MPHIYTCKNCNTTVNQRAPNEITEQPKTKDYECYHCYQRDYSAWYRSPNYKSGGKGKKCKYGIPPEKKPEKDDFETEREHHLAFRRWYKYYLSRKRFDVLYGQIEPKRGVANNSAYRQLGKIKFTIKKKPVPAPRLDLLPPPPAEWLI